MAYQNLKRENKILREKNLRMDNDTSYESFLKYQEAGLKASNIPKKLWKEPFTKFQIF